MVLSCNSIYSCFDYLEHYYGEVCFTKSKASVYKGYWGLN